MIKSILRDIFPSNLDLLPIYTTPLDHLFIVRLIVQNEGAENIHSSLKRKGEWYVVQDP
jgi:hypothetical protein